MGELEQTISDAAAITGDTADTEVKGPDEAHWGDAARAERGAEIVEVEEPGAWPRNAEGVQVGDDGEPVKGPDPAVWGAQEQA